MSILGTLFSKIFPSHHPAAQAATTGTSTPAGAASTASQGTPTGATATTTGAAPITPSPSGAAAQPVDVENVLNDMANKNQQKLKWRTSIVDLMKLVGMDSSLDSRKQLARELNYTGDTNDSASMNIWLHKAVMRKIAENGGKVPADLQH